MGYISKLGSPHCMQCPDGYFSDDSNGIECSACPQGYYCNSTSLNPMICTQSGLCLGGDASDPTCKEGFYLNAQGRCQLCDIGQYCTGGKAAGQCDAGYFCELGSKSPTPDTQCNKGFYCPHGATSMKQCPAGYFRFTKGGI